MDAATFLERHGLVMNPFAAEDAVQDAVLARSHDAWKHPDFVKILGDPGHPAPAVVFGERGAGKTALRLQMEHAYRVWNGQRTSARVLVQAHDDLDGMLAAIARHEGWKDPVMALEGLRLSDHVDAVLHRVVPRLVDQVLGMPEANLLQERSLRSRLRRAPKAVRRDLLLLQVVYDHPSAAVRRTWRLRGSLGVGGSSGATLAGNWSAAMLAVAAAMGVMGSGRPPQWSWLVPAMLLAACGLALGWVWVLRRARVGRVARRLVRSIRVLGRDAARWRGSLHGLPLEVIETSLPQDRGEDARYAMVDRLVRVLQSVDYGSLAILVDRVDEPACVAGDPARMRSLVWPMLSSRFLQHHGLAVKLLLPRELGEMAAREGGDFHRGARLDKQNVVERLQWTGSMLADLCDTRLRTATAPGRPPLKVEELFESSVGRSRVEEALERAGNPRDACRLLYAAIQEHLAHAGADEHRVSAGALEWVKRHRSVLGPPA